ncbi:MAG: sulfur carrier protein ThiS [Bacillaceae bacterium]|nr:sulfur carrier protein ThiS [Bacillaceae bacterium]
MKVIVNGKQTDVPNTITVSQLLEHYQLHRKVVIVEVNGSIMNKDLYPETIVHDGDKIEFVHFVGGG